MNVAMWKPFVEPFLLKLNLEQWQVRCSPPLFRVSAAAGMQPLGFPPPHMGTVSTWALPRV